MKSKTRKYFLSVLIFYIIIQLAWWAYLIIDLYHKIEQQEIDILLLSQDNTPSLSATKYTSKIIMIVGEAIVFFTALFFLLRKIQTVMDNEIDLAEQKANFVLSITHELKTPLASNRLYIQTVRQRELTIEKRNELLDKAVNDNKRLTNLVETILMSSQIETNSLKLHLETTDINQYITSIIHQLQESILKNHEIIFQTNQTKIERKIDTVIFKSVIINLIENAVKYTPKNTKIKIITDQQNKIISISVIDEGAGIKDSDQKYIFDQFYRIENENTRKQKGTGLGLYLVKKIIELHNGSIKVKSKINKGTEFKIEIPNNIL